MEDGTKEVWNVEQLVDDMMKFCIHIRHQTEKFERELNRIREEIKGDKNAGVE